MKTAIVGWRGMVGSVLMQRMAAERDLDHVDPVFFSTSQVGGAAPVIGGHSAVEVVELSVVLVAHLAHAQQASQHGARAPAPGAGPGRVGFRKGIGPQRLGCARPHVPQQESQQASKGRVGGEEGGKGDHLLGCARPRASPQSARAAPPPCRAAAGPAWKGRPRGRSGPSPAGGHGQGGRASRAPRRAAASAWKAAGGPCSAAWPGCWTRTEGCPAGRLRPAGRRTAHPAAQLRPPLAFCGCPPPTPP